MDDVEKESKNLLKACRKLEAITPAAT